HAGMSDDAPATGVEREPTLDVPYRERERSVTLERMPAPGAPVYGTQVEPETELFTINMGPHHPATRGVLRLLLTLEGETVRSLTPIIGYVHTGIEKSCEDQQYWKVIPPGFDGKCREFLAEMPSRIDQYEAILDRNEILLQRLRNVSEVPLDTVLGLGVTGPLLRAAGHPWDLRKAMPYSSYEHFDF